MKADTVVLGVVMVIGLIVLLAVLFTLPTYFLWNWLMPSIFDLREITLLQALGLNLLCGILFRSDSSSKHD